MPATRMVNVGCGRIFHPAWINLDFEPATPAVQRCDLRRGLPFGDGTVDVVYHSHVLEHLTPADGRTFLAECRRVLKPGGILRVAVPDLEALARAYLAVLDDPHGIDRVMHDWLRLEFADQLARSRSGGDVIGFLQGLSGVERARIRCRIGAELDQVFAAVDRSRDLLTRRIQRAGWRRIARRVRHILARGLVFLVGGAESARAYNVGQFRLSGEIHQTVYDAPALKALMEDTGFRNVMRCRAGEGRIANFGEHGLETMGDEVRKPDSLFMEAIATCESST